MLLIKSWIFLFLLITAIGFLIYFFPAEITTNNLTASLSEILDTTNLVEISDISKSELSDFVLIEEVTPAPQISLLDQRQDLIDDITEKLDIIKQQAEVLAQQEEQDKIAKELENKKLFEENCAKENYLSFQCSVLKTEQESAQQQVVIISSQTTPATNYTTSSGGGGSSPIVYPKILISEVQVASVADTKEEFVELYNPNNQEVILTDWYLQRKTESAGDWSTYAPSSLFLGKSMPANGYFLIAREGFYTGLADIFVDKPITDNNAFAFKNPNREISDKLGFGLALDFELLATTSPSSGQSIGRKFLDNTEQDTDNNSADFELDTPTPKAQNQAYQEPEPPAPTDTTSPEISFSLASTQSSLDFSVNFTITDILETVTPSGLASFNFRWKEEVEGIWHEDGAQEILGAPLSIDLIKTVSGSDGQVFSFQAKATDTVGNESVWLPDPPAATIISIPREEKPILINEVQIDSIDGPGGTSDDWVELYNPNVEPISLEGWSIQRFSKKSPCSIPEEPDSRKTFSRNEREIFAIPAGGYYLIVGTNANDALLGIADMTIGWSLTEDNTIYLVKSEDSITSGEDSNIADKVGFGAAACFPESTPVSNPEGGESFARLGGVDTNNNSVDFTISDSPTPTNSLGNVLN